MTPDSRLVFFLGSHPALSAAEVAAWAERSGVRAAWDLSRLPVALFGEGLFPPPADVQPVLGGTTMTGTLRAMLDHWPAPEELVRCVPEMLQPRQGKRIIGLSALVHTSEVRQGTNFGSVQGDVADRVKRLAMDLKKHIGMKGTRVVFPPARRPDLSTAQLLHNRLSRDGVAVVLLVRSPTPGDGRKPTPGVGVVDIVTVDTMQDIEAYTRRDRGRPHADPGTGMLPPKVAQMLLNLSLVPPGGTIYDPFCGVGTIPMEALLMGLRVDASDISPKQADRTKENLAWLVKAPDSRIPTPHAAVFVHDITAAPPPLEPGSLEAIVTEGTLGPPRTTPPLPRETEATFSRVRNRLVKLLQHTVALLRPGGRLVMTVPAFRSGRRLRRFPLESVRARGFVREPLVPAEWHQPLFREARARGTLLYGRPDAIVLREFVRLRKSLPSGARPPGSRWCSVGHPRLLRDFVLTPAVVLVMGAAYDGGGVVVR